MTDLTQDATVPDAIAAKVAAWEDPPRAPSAASAPVLSVDGFAGPLDWLLEMVRARQIDLARLSVVALVEAFAGDLFGFLSTEPNAEVGALHPKAIRQVTGGGRLCRDGEATGF